MHSFNNRTVSPPPTIHEVVVDEAEVHDDEAAGTPTVFATLVTFDEDPTTTASTLVQQGTTPTDHDINHAEGWMMNSDESSYEQRQDQLDARKRCLLHGCICAYVALDFNCHTIGCSRTSDCLCIRHNSCCALYHPHYGLGISIRNSETCYDITNDAESSSSLLNAACICCECGLIKPNTLCTSTDQCLCLQAVGSIPFHPHYVPRPILAYYGFSCCPTLDCCVAPPPSPTTKLQQRHQSSYPNHYTTFHILPPSSSTTPMYDQPMYRD